MKIEIQNILIDNIQKNLDIDIDSYDLLGNGEHNVNYILNCGEIKYVLRIYANTQFENSKKEFDILNKLQGLNCAKCYYLDTSKTFIQYDYMIQEFVEGKTLKEFDEENLKKLARVLREIHKIKISSNRKPLIDDWTKNNFLQNSEFLDRDLGDKLREIFKSVHNLFEENITLFNKYDQSILIHNDIVPENIIEKENGELVLIDWELSREGYFFEDFGSITAEYDLSDDLEKLFLGEYGFGKNLDELKILQLIKINRILSMIGWFIERLSMSKRGVESFVNQDDEKYGEILSSEIVHINDLINEFNKL